jgi:formylglycine-generating enzyme required for sulfatase activity
MQNVVGIDFFWKSCGAWLSDVIYCRVTERAGDSQTLRLNYIGFRVFLGLN